MSKRSHGMRRSLPLGRTSGSPGCCVQLLRVVEDRFFLCLGYLGTSELRHLVMR